MHPSIAGAFLKDFQKGHPYLRILGNFNDISDEPDFAVDQRFTPLLEPPYTGELPINSALLG